MIPAIRAALALSTALLAATPTASQTLHTGEVRGEVRAAGGEPLGEAIVLLVGADGGSAREEASGRDGRFSFTLLGPGVYSLRVERLGYRPLVIAGVRVDAGTETRVSPALTRGTPDLDAVDSVTAVRAGTAILPPLGLSFRARLDPPGRLWTLRDLASRAGGPGELSLDDLPTPAVELYVDGLPQRSAAQPSRSGTHDPPLGVPTLALESATFQVNALAAARSGESGSAWSLVTRAAPRRATFESFGHLQRLASGSGSGSSAPALEAGLLVGGPVLGDSISAILAFEAVLDDRVASYLRAAPSDALARVQEVARGSFGVDLVAGSGLWDAGALSTSTLAGIDWRGAGQALRVRARLGTTDPRGDPRGWLWARSLAVGPRTDVGASLSLESDLGGGWTNEIRVGASLATRGSPPTGSRDVPVETAILDADLVVGGGVASRADFSRTEASLSQLAHLRVPGHRLTVGVIGTASRHRLQREEPDGVRFLFGGATELASGAGSFTEVVAAGALGSVWSGDLRAILEDRWIPAPALELFLGIGARLELRGSAPAMADPTWFALTGLDSIVPPTRELRWEPRIGLGWRISPAGDWRLQLAGGVYGQPLAPEIVSELYDELGTTRIRRAVGVVGGWPAAPDSLSVPFVGARLALAHPDLSSPRTARGTATLSGRPWSGARVTVGAAYRWTDRLPRRTDLNRLPLPSGADQYGRPLYGELVQLGSLLQPVPRSNRRFDAFDRVSLIRSDGESRQWAATASVEQSVGSWFSLVAAYAYSRTVDNLPSFAGTGSGAPLPLDPSGEGGAWLRGTGDLDIPHRATVGAELEVSRARLSARYHLRSGLAFTPGFQHGVDANGDGVDGNDPAYLDPAMPGFAELMAEWPCLRGAAGIAPRNGCRASVVSALDLRLAIGLASGAELYADLFNLLATAEILPDPALYLIDRDRALTSDAKSFRTTVPLRVNQRFGRPLVTRSEPLKLGVGLILRF